MHSVPKYIHTKPPTYNTSTIVLEIVVFVVVAVEAFTKYWYFGSKLCAIIFNKFR